MKKILILMLLFEGLSFSQSMTDMLLLMGDTETTDTIPSQFTFTDITGANTSTVYTSNGVALAGFDSASIYAAGANYRIGVNGSWVTAQGTSHSGDTIYVKLTSGSDYLITSNVVLTIGGVSDTYSVTTKTQTRGIHLANFEGDSLISTYSGFNSISDGGVGAELSVRDTARLYGNKGYLTYQINPVTEGDMGYGTISFTARDSIYIRWYMTISRGQNNATGICLFGINALNNIVASNLYLTATTTGVETNKLKAGVTNDVTPVGWVPSDTLRFEAFYKKGTGADGIFKLWINGTQKYSATNLNTTQQCSTAFFGVNGVPSRVDQSWWIKFDEIKIDSVSIGAYGQ